MNIIAQAASGSISLLRLSGPDALQIASRLLSAPAAAKIAANPRLAVLAKVYEFAGGAAGDCGAGGADLCAAAGNCAADLVGASESAIYNRNARARDDAAGLMDGKNSAIDSTADADNVADSAAIAVNIDSQKTSPDAPDFPHRPEELTATAKTATDTTAAANVASGADSQKTSPDAADFPHRPEDLATPHAPTAPSAPSSPRALIDTALVIYFAAPASFTGEDVVEFHLHGGYATAERAILALLAAGARAAGPGEFSKRACLNGKMTAAEALALNELINAKSARSAAIVAKNIDAPFLELISATQSALTHTLAHIETAIDYADDDLPADILAAAAAKLEQNARAMAQIAERSERKRGLVEGFRLAIIGEPNVGKSSTLNALLGAERAIVSDIPGTTRDSVEELLNFGGFLLRLIDTAGIRERPADAIEQIGIQRAQNAISQADLLVFIADGSRELSADGRALLERCEAAGKRLFLAVNKSDLPPRCELASRPGALRISAANADVAALKEAIIAHCASVDDDEFFLTNAALVAAFARAGEHLGAGGRLLLAGEAALELAAHHLQAARRELAAFAGGDGCEELYDAMFSSFCLGK